MSINFDQKRVNKVILEEKHKRVIRDRQYVV